MIFLLCCIRLTNVNCHAHAHALSSSLAGSPVPVIYSHRYKYLSVSHLPFGSNSTSPPLGQLNTEETEGATPISSKFSGKSFNYGALQLRWWC
ncbi:hypothetical protein BXZ70DRAFT_256389 [Cristinia sonorae]|uniref:Uncharacterized protein n=1 Tax=Cristinia sonorae TaxID=1940300 RepID=A0A8K0XUF4_9AGAR|nr:hypothetical protein BXZ70DRAFT_256389 [Cristinia sonorae]